MSSEPSAQSAPVLPSPGKMAVVMLIFGLIACAVLPIVDRMMVLQTTESTSEGEAFDNAVYMHNIQKAAVQVALVGLVLGASVGLARGVSGMAIGAIVAAVVGAGTGALTWEVVWQNYKVIDREVVVMGITISPVLREIFSQVALWSILGLVLGILFWCLRGQTGKAGLGAIGGILGGLLAGVAYSLLASFAFPNSSNLYVVPELLTHRLAWAALGALAVGFCIVTAAEQRAPKAGNEEAIEGV